MKKVSFVIPIYNEEEGIRSFLEKDFLPIVKNNKNYKNEVILINDGSTDKTLAILQEFAVIRVER